jgi:hypothetical protein
MGSLPSAEEPHGVRGAVDRGALLDFRDAFERLEPLADGRLDDFLDPRTLHVEFEAGVGDASRGRLDVVWTTDDDYTVHYTDDAGRDCRWDRHPHDYPAPADDRHFHPPPDAPVDADTVEASCIEVTETVLVAMAVHRLWRDALDAGSLDGVNDARRPP